MHIYARQSVQQSMANLNSKSYHSLIGFLTPEYLEFLKLQVIPRFTGTGIRASLVPVNRIELGYLNLSIVSLIRP